MLYNSIDSDEGRIITMEEERDFVVFTDDDGNEFELDVITYFDHNDKEYAILADCSDKCGCCEDECEG